MKDQILSSRTTAVIAFFILICARPSFAHDGPDPAAKWEFTAKSIKDQTLKATMGPDLSVGKSARVETIGRIGALLFDEGTAPATMKTADQAELKRVLPAESFTLSAWVTIDSPQQWGGIIGYFQDNGPSEQGWVLGYNPKVFTIGLATKGSDDGDGSMTYLAGKTTYTPGKFHHVAATYDGTTLSLYVDGKLEATSKSQSGAILYPKQETQLSIGSYKDQNEDIRHHGRIAEVALYHQAAKAEWIKEEYGHGEDLLAAQAQNAKLQIDSSVKQAFQVKPFLQWVTKTGITVTWETTRGSQSTLHWGETSDCKEVIRFEGETILSARGFIYQQRLGGLNPDTQYFYRVSAKADNGETVTSEVKTFQTAPEAGTPFAIAVISDTQGNLNVAKKIAEMAWSERPSFVLHAGDLVSTGTNKNHWTKTFFPSVEQLISRAAIFPVLGNHENDADFYYHYMDLPKPEYYYTFQYSNMQVFMLDTNRNVQKGSEQYEWLKNELAKSKADWKVVCHHHPPYSSDENDFGNLWKTNKSSRGTIRVRDLTGLYDQYDVDIVWNGHIHTYERTWPIRDGKPTSDKAPLYMITGGSGGGLENPGPYRNPFSNVVHRDHHYAMVHVNGNYLEVKAYDLQGKLFDTFSIDKRID